MAKLFGEMEDEKGIEVHKIANRQLCANFYYGSREHSIRGLKVCATVMPTEPETTVIHVDFFSPRGEVLYSHREKYIMPARSVMLREVSI